jgi:hypothetical protein
LARAHFHTALVVSGLMFDLCTRLSFAQIPEITDLQPLALVPGETTRLILRGKKLRPGAALWTSFPAQTALASAEHAPTQLTFKVTLDRATQRGIGALRLVGANGLSDFRLVMVDELPSVTAAGNNTDLATAQLLKLPVAVDGQCEELASHFYRLKLRRNQTVTIDVVAHRLASPFDPFVRVLAPGNPRSIPPGSRPMYSSTGRDPQERELASADDTPGCGADAQLVFTAPTGGDYVIELRDTRYAGGPEHGYRLRVGEFQPAPLRFLQEGEPVPGPAPELPTMVEVESSPRARQGPPGAVRQARSQIAALKSQISHPGRGLEAMKLEAPALIRGRFDWPGDRDAFEFPAKPDERWIVRGRTRSLGSPCDLYLCLEKPDGTRLAEANVTGADEGSLTNKFTAAGPVRLLVEELNLGGGPGFNYELEMVRLEPGFTLTLETNTVHATPGGEFELKVNATRREYDGPITLSLAGAPVGCSLTNHVIDEKKTSATLKVTVPARATPGQWWNCALVGRAQIGEREFATRASTVPALKAQFPQMLFPPQELDGLLTMSVRAP